MTTSMKLRGRISIWRKALGRVPRYGMVMLLIASLVLLGILFVFTSCSSAEREFPSFVYNSDRVLQAYETAVQIPEVLLLMPCYCGCGKAHGHKNLKDCFFNEDGSLNDHGAFCEICDMEVADIAKWQEEGHSLAQIRSLIDEKYPRYGEPTDTAPLTGPRISFDEEAVDIGEVLVRVPIDYTFHFENVGSAPLDIIDTWAKALVGCCPPTSVVGSTTLQPGEESTLHIGGTHHSSGPHEFEITVKSNDPVEPEKKLYLTVYIRAEEAETDASPPSGNQSAES